MARDGARSILGGPGCDSASFQFKATAAVQKIYTGICLLSSLYVFVNNAAADVWLQIYDTPEPAGPQDTESMLFAVPMATSTVGTLYSWEPPPEAFHDLRRNPNIRAGVPNPYCTDAEVHIFGGYPFAFGLWIVVSEDPLQLTPTGDATMFPFGTARYRSGEEIRRVW